MQGPSRDSRVRPDRFDFILDRRHFPSIPQAIYSRWNIDKEVVSYPRELFLFFLRRRSKIAFNGVNGGGLASWSKERRRSFPRINITSRRFFLRSFSIFRIIRLPIYDRGARKIERHPASIRRPEEEKYSNRPELAANAKRSDNESSFRP